MATEYESEKLVHVELDAGSLNSSFNGDDINLLREKTFNKELGQLIGQIFKNEEKNRVDHEDPLNETDAGVNELTGTADVSIPKEELLLEIEKLIYEYKFSDYVTAMGAFNPFHEDINVYDDIDDLESYLTVSLKQCGFDSYSILKFSVDDSAFRPHFSTFDETFNQNICIGIRDKIFKRINASSTGCIILKNEIEANSFLFKQYMYNAGNYYFVKLSSLYGNRECEIFKSRTLELTDFSEFLSPVLAILIPEDMDVTEKEIHERLLNYSSLPVSIYMLRERMYMDLQGYPYDTILRMIDLFARFFVAEDMFCIILSLHDFSLKENLFLFKYLLSKIKNMLIGSSIIIRASIDRVIILPRNGEFEEISKVIDEFSLINGDLVEYYTLEEPEKFRKFDLIRFFA